MEPVTWRPHPNRHLCKLQRLRLGMGLVGRRLRGEHLLVRVSLFGTWVTLDISAMRELRRAGEFPLESAMVEHIDRCLKDGDRVYDIGANIGLISLVLASRERGRGCEFHCFEPEPRNHDQLARNIAANALPSRLQAHRVALGGADGTAALHIRGTAGEGRHSIAEKKGATGTIEVPVMTLANFATAHGGPPDVIKVDVEGAEGEVLAGMEGMADSDLPRDVFLEIHNKGMRDRMPDGTSITGWLASRGYRVEWEQRRRSGVHCHYRRP